MNMRIKGVVRALTAAVSLAVAPGAGAEARVEVVAKPVEVTVYPQMARVEREGSCKLAPGSVTVVIGDLPMSADEASLRVWLKGPRGTKLHGVEVRTVHGSEAVEARVRRINRRVRELEDRKGAVDDRIAARNEELRMLKSWDGRQKDKVTGKGPGFTELTQGAEAIGKRIAQLMSENRVDSIAARDIAEQIHVLRRDANAAASSQTDRRVVEAEVTATGTGRVSFRLAYSVPGASWEPVYNLSLDPDAKDPAVRVGFGARVIQRTGEDWEGVRMMLSNSRPAGPSQAPDPREGWAIGSAGRVATMSAVPAAAKKAMRRELGSDDADLSPVETVEFDSAAVRDAEFATRFVVDHPVSVKSGSEARRVGVGESVHPARIAIVAEPRRSLAAFVEATFTYQSDAPMLAGKAQLFQGDEFVGTTVVKPAVRGEEITLGFGQDASLRIERRLADQKDRQGGFGSMGKDTREYRWITTIVSGHGAPRTVEVREMLPKPRQSEVEVKVGKLSPGVLPDDPDLPGLKRWKIEVEPGKPAKIEFGYTIRHPAGRAVGGLG